MHREQIAAGLDFRRDGALLFGGKVGVLTRKDLARIRNETAHQLRAGKGNLLRRESLGGWLLFGAAHDWKKESERCGSCGRCQRAFLGGAVVEMDVLGCYVND